jgi:hypothetical protein
MTTLSERAMLVTLGISQWTARKLDRHETTALNRSHGLSVEAARVNKNLLPCGSHLEKVHQVTGAIRKDFARLTLPWGIDGVNILKSSAYVEFTQIANKWHSDWQGAVDEFMTAYPQAVEDARIMLNGLFKDEDYPPVEDLTRRFAFNIQFMPVPAEQDWRVDVGDAERERLKAMLTQQVVDAEARASQEAWRRVHEVVSRTYDRLKDPDTIFRDSLVENAVELCRVLPMLNITDNPDLERVRQQIEGSIGVYRQNADILRASPKAREDVAGQMSDIMSKMAGYFPA